MPILCYIFQFIFINKTDSACLEVALYTGEVCRDVFPVLQTCFSGVSSPPPPSNFPSGVDQVAGEANAVRLVNGLSLLNPTPQCSEAIIPFLCLSIFKLCDANGGVHNIISEDCHFLRDEVCAEEWSQAVGLLGDGILPVCEGLPDINDDCIGKLSSHKDMEVDYIWPGQGVPFLQHWVLQLRRHFFPVRYRRKSWILNS